MNKRNTLGKLAYIKSTETFAPTPAIELSQDPEKEAPDAAGPGETTQAIIAGMERARAEGMPDGSYRVAQALPSTAPAPAPGPPTAPSPGPAPAPINPGPAANDNVRLPNRVARPPAKPSFWKRLFPWLGRAAAANPEVAAGAAPGALAVGVGAIGISRAAGRSHQAQHGGGLTPFLNIPYEFDTGLPQPPPPAPPQLQPTEPVPTIGLTPGTVRVTEQRRRDACQVGPYETVSKTCAGQAHHIAPIWCIASVRAPVSPRIAARRPDAFRKHRPSIRE